MKTIRIGKGNHIAFAERIDRKHTNKIICPYCGADIAGLADDNEQWVLVTRSNGVFDLLCRQCNKVCQSHEVTRTYTVTEKKEDE
jgi:hypothetical protein